MLRQARDGAVDFITGDYLAEVNIAENGERIEVCSIYGSDNGIQHKLWRPVSMKDLLALLGTESSKA